MVTKQTLLNHLPEFSNQWILLKNDQSVFDIIHEVLKAHKEFAKDYDLISEYFYHYELNYITDQLFKFCKQSFRYIEEPEEEQTVSSPGAMLTRGHCDCKGYSNFIGGILDSLNRNGCKIDWCYRFASYNLLSELPHHVFIVVKDGNSEIWIDPTPGSDNKSPYWYTDKKTKNMPLYKISGMEDNTIIPAKMIWNEQAKRWIYDLSGDNTIGDITSDLADYGTQSAASAAETVIPGSGSIITAIGTALKNIFSGIFHKSDPAQSKIWFMFQIPKYNPTKQQVQFALDAAKKKWGTGAGADSNWIEAFNNCFKAYQAIIDLMNVRDQVALKYGVNLANYGILTGIGYTSSTGITINDADVIVRVTDPQTGPNDLQNIVDAINQQITKIKSGAASNSINPGGIIPTGTQAGINPLLLLAGGGVLLFALSGKKKVSGSDNTNMFLIGGAALLAWYLLRKPKEITSDTTTQTTSTTILPGDVVQTQEITTGDTTSNGPTDVFFADTTVQDPTGANPKDLFLIDPNLNQYGDVNNATGYNYQVAYL